MLNLNLSYLVFYLKIFFAAKRLDLLDVVKLQKYYNKSSAKHSTDEIKNYLLHLKKKNLSSNSYNVIIHALSLLYYITTTVDEARIAYNQSNI